MARPKKATSELTTLPAAQAAMYQLFEATIALEQHQAAMDLARAAATAAYEAEIDAHKTLIADLKLQLQTYYHRNPPSGRKSIDLCYGTIGTRTGNPTLSPLNRSWSWEAIAIRLRDAFGLKYFHAPKPPALDKDLIKDSLPEDQLKTYGMKIQQTETFFAEPDRSKAGAA